MQPAGANGTRTPCACQQAKEAPDQPVDDERTGEDDGDQAPGDRQGGVPERRDRDREPDQEEHQGGQQERDERPDGVERFQRAARHTEALAFAAQHDAGHHRRDDPGLVDGIGDEIGSVGGQDRDRQLDQLILDPRNELGGDCAKETADDRAQDHHRHEPDATLGQ